MRVLIDALVAVRVAVDVSVASEQESEETYDPKSPLLHSFIFDLFMEYHVFSVCVCMFVILG